MLSRLRRMDSDRRWAARPVGAARRMRGAVSPPAIQARVQARSRLAAKDVLPVPGPPETTVKRFRKARASAFRCKGSNSITGAPDLADSRKG